MGRLRSHADNSAVVDKGILTPQPLKYSFTYWSTFIEQLSFKFVSIVEKQFICRLCIAQSWFKKVV